MNGAPFVLLVRAKGKDKNRSFPPLLTPANKNRSPGTPMKNGYGQDDTVFILRALETGR
jgi:hypothetical protein